MVLTKQLYHQRGELTQGEPAFKYEMDHQGAGLTGMGGFCRLPGKAFNPAAKEALKGLCKVNKGMVGFVQNNRSEGKRPRWSWMLGDG